MAAKHLLTLLLFLLLCICATAATADSGWVRRVDDGDTLLVVSGRSRYRVRLYGIDAPERGQPYAAAARSFVRTEVLGKKVRVEVRDRDRYGRTVAIVRLANGTSLNEEMLRNGLAWWYRRYSDDSSFRRLESRARSERRGLWREPNPEPPWTFRRTFRSGADSRSPFSSR